MSSAVAAPAASPAPAAKSKKRAATSDDSAESKPGKRARAPNGEKSATATAPGRLAKSWCFTLNNPAGPLEWPDAIVFGVYQPETGKNGTPHFQGYFELVSPLRMTGIKEFGAPWDKMHLEGRRGSQKEAIAYCQKSDTATGPFVMHGIPTAAGTSSRYAEMIADLKSGMALNQIREVYADEYVKHHRGVDSLFYTMQKPTLLMLESDPCEPLLTVEGLRPWQALIYQELIGVPKPRQVTWIYNKRGGAGKSAFVRMLGVRMNIFVTKMTARDRTAHAFLQHRPTPQAVIFDLIREDCDRLSVGVMEDVKDGNVSTTFQAPRSESFVVPHVFVFANCLPPTEKMTPSRWRILNLVHVKRGHALFDITHEVANAAGWVWNATFSQWELPPADIQHCPDMDKYGDVDPGALTVPEPSWSSKDPLSLTDREALFLGRLRTGVNPEERPAAAAAASALDQHDYNAFASN